MDIEYTFAYDCVYSHSNHCDEPKRWSCQNNLIPLHKMIGVFSANLRTLTRTCLSMSTRMVCINLHFKAGYLGTEQQYNACKHIVGIYLKYLQIIELVQ